VLFERKPGERDRAHTREQARQKGTKERESAHARVSKLARGRDKEGRRREERKNEGERKRAKKSESEKERE